MPEIPEVGQPDRRLSERRSGDARAEATAAGSNGPGRAATPTRRPPTIAAALAAATVARQSAPAVAPTARMRWGRADPTVNAPIRTPIASPRSRRNQPASILSAIG